MRFFRKPAPKTDDEIVAGVRRLVDKYDRWRPWLVVIHLFSLGVAAFGVLVMAWVLQGLGQGIPFRLDLIGLCLGLLLGIWLGQMSAIAVQGLGAALFGFQTERLLLKYHDELMWLQVDEKNSAAGDDDRL